MAADQTAPESGAPEEPDPQQQRRQNRTVALMLAGLGALMLASCVGVVVLVLHFESVYAAAAG